jgi:hypothetical protein
MFLSTFQYVNLPVCQLASVSTCQCVNLPVCQLTGLSTCQFVNLPVCQVASLSTCQFVNLPVCQVASLSTCQYVNLPVRQLDIVSTCISPNEGQFVEQKSGLAAALSLTKFITIIVMILLTLWCAALVCQASMSDLSSVTIFNTDIVINFCHTKIFYEIKNLLISVITKSQILAKKLAKIRKSGKEK